MRDDFCAFILTHGRADRVVTYRSLKKAGYTGKIYIVVDDEDDMVDDYKKEFGDKVLVFSKEAVAKTLDEGDNFNDRRAILYARKACFDLAKQVGCKYFVQLDDDYKQFTYKFNQNAEYHEKFVKSLDDVFAAVLRFYESAPAILTLALAQNGDFIGGQHAQFSQSIGTKRKAMNTFFCSVDRPFDFFGRCNEDVSAYTCLGRKGQVFLTINTVSIGQLATQSLSGGMTDLYKEGGTYIKSFYSVMYSPSCVKVSMMGTNYRRMHHRVSWDKACPKIIHTRHRGAA